MLSFAAWEVKQREKRLRRIQNKNNAKQHQRQRQKPEQQQHETPVNQDFPSASQPTFPNPTRTTKEEDNAFLSSLSIVQPLQHAILQDLLLLQSKFLDRLVLLVDSHQHNSDHTNDNTYDDDNDRTNDNHHSTPFECFRHVAQEYKLAALHQQCLPPRCDAASYSQLIYAACGDLLKFNTTAGMRRNTPVLPFNPVVDSAVPTATAAATTVTTNHSPCNTFENQDPLVFVLAPQAFAIFALYMLHETNPLPRPPSIADASVSGTTTRTSASHDDDNNNNNHSRFLSVLPLRLTNRQNPQLLHRRNYRPWIRVDPELYTLLLQLRETVLVAATDGDLTESEWKSHSATRTTTTTRTRTLLAIDLGHVLDRLWPHLDLVAYIGPMGLHGLSQRQQILASLQQNNKESKEAPAASWVAQASTNDGNAALLSESSNKSKKTKVGQDTLHSDDDDDDDEPCERRAKKPGDDDQIFENDGGDDDDESNKAIQTKLETYLQHRRALRLPPSNTPIHRLQRIRQSMRSMSLSGAVVGDQPQYCEWETKLRKIIQQPASGRQEDPSTTPSPHLPQQQQQDRLATGSQRVVTFALPAPTERNSSDNDDDDDDRGEKSRQDRSANTTDDGNPTTKTARPLETFKLVLPSQTSKTDSRSLEVLFQTLVHRLGTNLVQIASDNTAAAQSESVTQQTNDEEESLATNRFGSSRSVNSQTTGGTTNSMTSGSAVGRDALQTLLARAADDHSVPSQVADTNDDPSVPQNESLDDVSMVSTTSAVGQSALQALLAQAGRPTRAAAAKKGTKRTTGAASKRGTTTASVAQNETVDESSCGGVASVSAVGQSALQTLLAQAGGGANEDALASTNDDERSLASSAVGRNALQVLLANAGHHRTKKSTKETTPSVDAQRNRRRHLSSFLDGEEDEEEDDYVCNDDDVKDNQNKKRKATKSNGKRKKPAPRRPSSSKPKSPSQKRSKKIMMDEISDVSSGSEGGGDGTDAMSTAGASAVGRKALEDLLQEAGRVTGNYNNDDDDDDDDDDEDDSCTTIESENDNDNDTKSLVSKSGTSAAGRRALQELLMAANGSGR